MSACRWIRGRDGRRLRPAPLFGGKVRARAARGGLCAVCGHEVPEDSSYTSYCRDACARRASDRRRQGRPVSNAEFVPRLAGRPRADGAPPLPRAIPLPSAPMPRTRNPFDDPEWIRARQLTPQDVRRMRATAARIIETVDGGRS